MNVIAQEEHVPPHVTVYNVKIKCNQQSKAEKKDNFYKYQIGVLKNQINKMCFLIDALFFTNKYLFFYLFSNFLFNLLQNLLILLYIFMKMKNS